MTRRPAHHRPGRWVAPLAALAIALVPAGCSVGDDPGRLVVATPWPPAARAAVEQLAPPGDRDRILWVELGPHRWLDACERRGGVDLILGGSPRQFLELADAGRLDPIAATDPALWRQVELPPLGDVSAAPGRPDPRDDPAALAEARAVLATEGWEAGYATLIRRPVASLDARGGPPVRTADRHEVVGLVRGGRHRAAAHELLGALGRPLLITAPAPDALVAARADDLLADLLGAALVDARNERRDAQIALADSGRTPFAAAALGEAPPWPPASVAKLRADPARASLADVLAGQMVTDALALDWLEHSWRRPNGRVDAALLREIAEAADGRLAREPRFRAWLRGEWTAWTQQLDRRVARLAGGYRPQ